jgi:DNA-binding Lrp family transcriptional regulator/predicted AAA+ superfamily ATPase
MKYQQTSDHIAAQNQQSLEILVRSLNLSQQNFAIILAHFNYQTLKISIEQRLQEMCSLEIRTVTIAPSSTTLYTAIQNHLENHQPQGLMVFGIDALNGMDQVFASTNHIREEFRKQFTFPVVLWINDSSLKKLTQLAPDFASWTTTVKFELATDELVQLIRQSTEHIFKKALDLGAHQFIPKSMMLDSIQHQEIHSAMKDLETRHVELPSELQARLEFILGLDAYVHGNMEESQQYFEKSLGFWQQSQYPKQRACLMYYLGLWWRKSATLNRQLHYQHRQFYQQNCHRACEYFRQCIDCLEESGRLELAAKFINAVGEVLQRLADWDELAHLAEKAIALHQEYPNSLRLAYACGLLGEVALAREDWQKAQQLAERALATIENADKENSVDQQEYLNWEKQINRGWYLLILAYAKQHQSEVTAAIEHLKEAQSLEPHRDPHLHTKILKELCKLYQRQGDHENAFNYKRKLYSVEQQYGFRAFVGAGYLQPCKSQNLTNIEMAAKQEWSNIIAPEIPASGRNQDVVNLMQRLQNHYQKLVILYGPSGVGKSSLIKAGLVPALEHQGNFGNQRLLPITIQKYSQQRWIKDLGQSLVKGLKVYKDITFPLVLDSTEAIMDSLKQASGNNLMIIIIFDQFEEFFFGHSSQDEREKFYRFLRDCLQLLSVKVILSLREDYLHYLLECERTVNLSAIGNDILSKDFLYYLGNLSKQDAKLVIEALNKRTQHPLEPQLVEQVVEDLAGEMQTVRPIELQLVGAELEESHISCDEYCKDVLKADERIEKTIKSWLNRVIQDCGHENEDTAWKVLYLLTDREDERTIKTLSELTAVSSALSSKLRSRQIKFILKVLLGSGLVLKLREDSTDYYQLTHDYLVPSICKGYSHRFDGLGQTINKLRSHLLQDDPFSRLAAVIEIGKLGSSQEVKLQAGAHVSSQAIELLKHLLDRNSSDMEIGLRWYIFNALAQISDEEGIELILKKGLCDPEPAIQAHAAHLLGHLQVKQASNELVKHINQELNDRCQNSHQCVRTQSRWAMMQLQERPEIAAPEPPTPLLAYVLVKGALGTSAYDDQLRLKALRNMPRRGSCGIVECGVTYGDYDFIIKVMAENMQSLNDLIMGNIPSLNWVKSTRTFIVVNEPRRHYWRRRSCSITPKAAKYVSYVFLEADTLCSAQASASLIACLMDIEEVAEAATVYGYSDVIAKIEAPTLERRDAILTDKISRIPSVSSTHSYPVINSTKNTYWDNSESFPFPEIWFL